MAKRDAKRVGAKSVSQAPDFSTNDFDVIAHWVKEEHTRRKGARKDLDRQWDEIDRQLRMEPSTPHKTMANGQPDPKRAWMAEIELPFQAQTLETLNADTRRLKFPAAGQWFRARAALTDDYLQRFESLPSPTGSVNDPGSLLNQDIGDKLAMGLLSHWHSQYDFKGNYDRIDAEAFKYGTGVGRLRKVTKRIFLHNARGTVEEKQTFPVFVPQSLRHTYLDDRETSMAAEGHIVGPVQIFERTKSLADLRLAANQGSTDIEDEQNGGWMPSQLQRLTPDRNGLVQTLEAEGDLVIPRGQDSLYIPGVIVSIAIGNSREAASTSAVYRFRYREQPFSSYILHPYHYESLNTPYATSPLMKGWPIQDASAQSLNRVMDTGLLNALPPLSYNPDDVRFAAEGGPDVYPGVKWPTLDGVLPHMIGDPTALLASYQALVAQYYDVVGVNPPRLGAQTLSHTTAFAKDAEISRGVVRTVDFVRASLSGPMTRLLDMEYRMGLEMLGRGRIQYFVEPWNEFVFVNKGHLPEIVHWQALGASGPASEAEDGQQRAASAQLALQVDNVAVQMGREPAIDHRAMVEQILLSGGWQEIPFLNETQAEQVGPVGQQAPGVLTQNPGGNV